MHHDEKENNQIRNIAVAIMVMYRSKICNDLSVGYRDIHIPSTFVTAGPLQSSGKCVGHCAAHFSEVQPSIVNMHGIQSQLLPSLQHLHIHWLSSAIVI